MKFMMLIHLGDAPSPYGDEWQTLTEEERNSISRGYQELNEAPGVTPGLQLKPPDAAVTVRVTDGETQTTDGPIVAVEEALGGYFMFEADDLDSAVEVASRVPAARMGGAVEVRPIMEW